LDDQHVHRPARGLEAKPQLFLKCREQRQAGVGIRRLVVVRCELQLEVE